MAQYYYKIAGTTNPSTDWRTFATLSEDRVISTDFAVQLSSEEKESLEGSGLILERVSADEAQAMAAQQDENIVGSDVAGSAPVFNQPEAPVKDEGDKGESNK